MKRNNTNSSLQKLADFISAKADSDIITRPALERVIQQHQIEIIELLSPIVEISDTESIESALMASVWELLYEKDYIFTNMNADFQLIRDVVTSPKNFNKHNDEKNKSELIDSRGVLRGVAEVRLDTDNESPLWIQLVEQTLSSLDEFTADLFDLISYLWVVSPKNSDGYIVFESDYALRLRFADPLAEDFKIRERERFSIMRRVAALSSIWISMRDDNITVINYDTLLDEDRKNYDFQSLTQMFHITSLQMAYDRTTGEAKGIYSLQIRPTPVIQRYLNNAKQTFGPLDMKVFKFHHITQREHKRLTRFLNYQWKIRTIQRSVARPFKVETLVNVMKFAARTRLNTRMEVLRTVLNDLVETGVIKDWYYGEDFDESKLLKRGGSKIWMEQNVFITPPDTLTALNKEKILLENVKESFASKKVEVVNTEQLSLLLEQGKEKLSVASSKSNVESITTEKKLSLINEYMQNNGFTLRMVSNETDVSTSTLMRYLNGSVKNMKQPTIDALYSWYETKISNGSNYNKD
ncbi:helix-turn-helix domain-containing protein [Solibacillus sp. NPDC093137]|uniref:helix-turn-helix domain-containing protein n=1 Tax=Solibacillus sp. NPDC093137 TaxID=3390678 RepID=UPI003D08918C